MAFGDIFAGFQQAAADHYSKLLSMQYGMRQAAAEHFAKLGDDPRFDEPSQMALKHKSLEIMSGDPSKPISSKDLDIKNILVQPPTPPGATTPQSTPMPQTGPLPSAGQMDIAPPGPPPSHPLEMMPFAQQMERAAQESVAKSTGAYGIAGMKASIPQKVGRDTTQVGGQRFPLYTYQRRDPVTGQMQMFTIQGDLPLGNFAPRLGQPITARDLSAWQEYDPGARVLDEDNKPLDIQKIMQSNPDFLLEPIGEDRFRPVTERKNIKQIGQYETQVGSVTGKPGEKLGQVASTLPINRQVTVPMPGGKLGKTTLTTTRGEAPSFVPGSTIPPLGQEQQQVQAPTAPPITSNDINRIITSNPWMSKLSPEEAQHVASAVLTQNQQAPGSVPSTSTAAPAPTAPPPAQANAGVTEIPGAGHGLTAEQVMDTGKRAEAYQNTVERIVGLLQGFTDPKMRSVLERAKLSIVTSPDSGIKLVLGNLAQLNPQERKMASDFVSLSEDVNVLRSMYGATGFRSKEALAVLLGQRGELLENPQVFTGVLRNTLQSIVTQLEPMAKTLSENGRPVIVTPALANAYKYLNNNDAAAARQRALGAGYQLPK